MKTSAYKNYKHEYKVKDNSFWVVLGNSDDELINDIFNDSDFTENDGIEREGCYEYNAAIYYMDSMMITINLWVVINFLSCGLDYWWDLCVDFKRQ